MLSAHYFIYSRPLSNIPCRIPNRKDASMALKKYSNSMVKKYKIRDKSTLSYQHHYLNVRFFRFQSKLD